LLESAYEACLAYELRAKGLRVEQQSPVRLVYDDVVLDCGYRLDLLVDGNVIVEVKSVETLQPIHTAQVLTYLRLSGARQALLLNFHCATLKEGLRSFLAKGSDLPHEADHG
jgi:GxxExxY protein